MTFTNYETKEIHCKILYFGPPSCGKSANLRSLFTSSTADPQNGVWQLQNEQNNASKYFDFLPLSIGYFKDFHVKFHLYGVPSVFVFSSVRKLLFRGADGVVFVVDSRREKFVENTSALTLLKTYLEEEGTAFSLLPKVFQYNKRDLKDIHSVSILREALNEGRAQECEASALHSRGTLETLENIGNQVVSEIKF